MSGLAIETVPISELRPHPRNYVVHPEDEIEHLAASIREHGIYKNIVTARDLTILAGHGVVQGAKRAGREEVPIYRMDLDPDEPRALKLLAGDNEIAHLREMDDRALTELLKEVRETDVNGLLGTGYDEMMLANLTFVTRPASEIANLDEASHWVGLPEYRPQENPVKVVVSCETEDDRRKFLDLLGVTSISKTTHGTLSIWWPLRVLETVTPLRFEEGSVGEDAS